jgi:hypothetical protein
MLSKDDRLNVRSRTAKCVVAWAIFVAVVGGGAVLAAAAGAQNAQAIPQLSGKDFGWLADTEFLPPASGPGPVTFDKAHPYVRNNTVGQPTFRIGDVSNPILQPWVVERMRKDNEEVLAGKFAFTARSSCWPAGVPGFLVFGCGARTVYFIQTAKEVVMISDGDAQVRHVYLNVPHSGRARPSWYGESVGHYEGGDTLVVDTVAMNDRSFIDNYRTPHSERLHVVERWKLAADGKSIEVALRVEDPGAFTIAWDARQVYQRVNQGPLAEQVCAENNFILGQDTAPIPMAQRPDF